MQTNTHAAVLRLKRYLGPPSKARRKHLWSLLSSFSRLRRRKELEPIESVLSYFFLKQTQNYFYRAVEIFFGSI
jgi:hypothetical protein